MTTVFKMHLPKFCTVAPLNFHKIVFHEETLSKMQVGLDILAKPASAVLPSTHFPFSRFLLLPNHYKVWGQVSEVFFTFRSSKLVPSLAKVQRLLQSCAYYIAGKPFTIGTLAKATFTNGTYL